MRSCTSLGSPHLTATFGDMIQTNGVCASLRRMCITLMSQPLFTERSTESLIRNIEAVTSVVIKLEPPEVHHCIEPLNKTKSMTHSSLVIGAVHLRQQLGKGLRETYPPHYVVLRPLHQYDSSKGNRRINTHFFLTRPRRSTCHRLRSIRRNLDEGLVVVQDIRIGTSSYPLHCMRGLPGATWRCE